MTLCACGLCGRHANPGRRYIHGHNRKLPPRYTIDSATGCWLWAGRILPSGYGQYKDEGRILQAHIYFYEKAKGPVPEGLELDHLCSVKRCVNPDHLEAVTHLVNVRRSRVCRLNEGIVRGIHSDWARSSGVSRPEFAKVKAQALGVAKQTVLDVLDGDTWADLHPERSVA